MKDRLNLVYYHIQTNEKIHLSEKTKWDIESHVTSEVLERTLDAKKEMEYWRNLYFREKSGEELPKLYS